MEQKDKYFAVLDEYMLSRPFIYVRPSVRQKRGYKQPEFISDNSLISMPHASGVYLVYRRDEDFPFYCGEADSLSARVSFHFKDCPSVRDFSTLKKSLSEKRRDLQSMCDDLRLRIVEVPFGRNDVEEYLHAKYKINTKKMRKKA